MNAPLPKPFFPVTAPDRRGEDRQRTCFAIGKLVHADREHVCLVRNMSTNGVGIELDQPPPPGATVRIEARALPPCGATVVWAEGRLAGLRLDEDRDGNAAQGGRPRSPRFAFVRDIEMIVDGRLSAVRTADLALGGIRLATHVAAGVETPVVLLLGQHTLLGRLCWHAGGASGIRFTRPLTGADLSQLLGWNRA